MREPIRPNILFLFSDQHRPDWLGSNTALPLNTPHLDALAAAGTTFEQAFTPSPVCAPARACLASGRNYDHCGVPSNRENYPLEQPTFYQQLRKHDYHVCGVGKFDLHKDGANPPEVYDWGIDGSRCLKAWGFSEGIDNEGKFDGSLSYRAAGRPKGPYLDYLASRGLAELYCREHDHCQKQALAYVTELDEEAYCDNWIANNGLRFLKSFPRKSPWFLQVNFAGPHLPMDVTASMGEAWKDTDFPLPSNPGPSHYSEADHLRNRRHYAAMIENIDRQVGRFVQAVRERGELEQTLIVYSSDHGEMLGEHERWGKSVWWQPSVGIPLILAGPNIRPAQRSNALVSLQDLAATFLEVANVPRLPEMEAQSLAHVLEGKQEGHRNHICSALDDWRLVYDGRYKLVEQEAQAVRLYDLEQDPDEECNIAEAEPKQVRRLTTVLRGEQPPQRSRAL